MNNTNLDIILIDIEKTKTKAKEVVTAITSSNSMDKHSFIC